MLTYRLTGTTEASGSTTTNPTTITPTTTTGKPNAAPNLRAPWCASKTTPRCWPATSLV